MLARRVLGLSQMPGWTLGRNCYGGGGGGGRGERSEGAPQIALLRMGQTKVVGMETLLSCPRESVGRQREYDGLMGSWGPDHGGGKERGRGSGLSPSSSVALASVVGGICSRGAPSCVEPLISWPHL